MVAVPTLDTEVAAMTNIRAFTPALRTRRMLVCLCSVLSAYLLQESIQVLQSETEESTVLQALLDVTDRTPLGGDRGVNLSYCRIELG